MSPPPDESTDEVTRVDSSEIEVTSVGPMPGESTEPNIPSLPSIPDLPPPPVALPPPPAPPRARTKTNPPGIPTAIGPAGSPTRSPLPAAPERARRTTGSTDAVAELLRKAASASGGPAIESLERAAEMLAQRGEFEQSAWHLEEAVRRSAEGPVDQKLRARVHVTLAKTHEEHLGRLDRAVELLEAAHKLDPDQPRAIEAGRRIYRAVGDFEQVARLYEVELETTAGARSRKLELLIELSDVRERLAQLGAAAASLETALPLASEATRNEALREKLADLYAAPGFAEEEVANGAPHGLGRAGELYRDLARARHARGDSDGEIACYRRALGVNPDDVEAASGLESAYRKADRDEELLRLYRQAPWLPGASRRLAELAIARLRAGPQTNPGTSAPSRVPRAKAALDALFDAAQAGEPIADLLTEVENLLARSGEHARLAALHEQLLGLGDGPAGKDPLDRADRLVVIARHHKQAGDLVRFESALLDALAAYPGHDDAYHALAEHLTARRDHATLVAVAEAALQASPPDEHAVRLEELAELYDKRLGDVQGAVDAWQRRLEIGPSERAESELRRLRIKEQRWAGLVAQLERELELAASSDARAEVLRRLGQVHRERHDLERARQLFADALELRPTDPSLFRTLGELAELEGRFDDLAALLRRQYRVAKERVEKLNLLRRLAALYEERLGDWEGVEWACEEILTHLPSDRDALRRLELVHESKGPDGLEALLRVLEAHASAAATPAEKVELYRRLALRYEAAGRHDLAADRWERLIRLDKMDADATLALARAYERLDRHADAALAYSRLLDDARGRPGRPADALPEPMRVDAWRRYARILDQRIADPTRAVVAWQQFLRLRPADREALSALTALHRGRGPAEVRALEELLARRLAVAERDEAGPIALELAQLQRARGARGEARARLLALVGDLNLEELRGELGRTALVELVDLADAENDARGAIIVLERLYFAADAEERAPLARTIAERWTACSPSGPVTLLAWERVRTLQPDDPTVLVELSQRYASAALPARQREVDLTRLDLAEAAGDRTLVVELGESIALLVEEQLGDARAAFGILERVLGAPADTLHARVLEAIRQLAERAALHADLTRVLADEPGLAARIERARIFEDKLREPRRAFEVLRGAVAPEILASLGPAVDVAAAIVPHLLRLGERSGDTAAVLEALCELLPHLPRAQQAGMLRTRSEVREKRSKDLGGALDELLRAVAFIDEDDPAVALLDDDIHRLAQSTKRWEDLVALKLHRAARAGRGSERRHALLDEAAGLLEAQLRAPRRAFRVRLALLVQLPDPLTPPDSLRDEIWRLAALSERHRPPAGDPPPGRSRLEPLPIRGAAPPPVLFTTSASPIISTTRPERDPTLEVDIRDLVIESEKAPRDPTMEIQLGDLAEVVRGTPPPRPTNRPAVPKAPPPLPGMRGQAPRVAPPKPEVAALDWDAAWIAAAPALDQPLLALSESDGPWDELAAVLRRTDHKSGHPTSAARLAVAAMWENGAKKIDLAFQELRSAFVDPDAPAEVRGALDALAQRHGADDSLVAVLDDAIDETASSHRAIELLLDAAAIRERQGQLDDAEARYRRILGMQPDHPGALGRLEAYYRTTMRWDALAELLERRLNGLMEKLPQGGPREASGIELAEIYERTGKRYEAIATLEGILAQRPDHAGALVFLSRLYEAAGQWGKVIDSLNRRIDALEAGDGSATQPESRRLRLRIAEICEEKLERPERALDAYVVLDRAGLPDPQVETALERLYTQLQRWVPLAELYDRQSQREDRSEDERVELIGKRLAIFRDRAPDPKRMLTALRELASIRADDDAVLAELSTALAAQGAPLDERIELAAQRLRASESRDEAAPIRAKRLTELGALEVEAGRRAEAVHTLEQAIALAPEDPESLAQLARLREGGEDWHGYAEARERQAEVAGDDRAAVRALLDAARAELEHGGDRARATDDLDRASARCPADPVLLAELRGMYRTIDEEGRVASIVRRELELPELDAVTRADLHAQLGTSLAKVGDLDAAAAAFHAANEADPGYAAAVHGLADLAARSGEWDDVEPLLRYAATRQGVTPIAAAAFFRRLAEAAASRGNADEAYAALIEADRRQPGDLRTRVQLGRNRFAQSRYREAATHLGVVAEHPDLPRLGIEAAQALYEGAVAEVKIRRPERAEALLKSALAVDPTHDQALGLLSNHAIDRGDLKAAIALRERQAAATKDPTERALRWEKVGNALRDELGEAARAADALRESIVAWDAAGGEARPPASVLESLLALERMVGQVDRASATAERLLQYGASGPERARRLRDAASLEMALGHDDVARERLAAAYELDPADPETIAGYSALLHKLGDDEGTVGLLTRTLGALSTPETPADRTARAALWQRLAEARDRTKDVKGATQAYERVLALDPGRKALRQMLLERYSDDPADEQQVSAHRLVLLEEDPLDVPSLRALEKLELRAGRNERAAVLQALQSVAGALAVGRPIPIGKAGKDAARPQTPFSEAELSLLEHPDATMLSEVFAALYEGTPSDQIPDLAALGVAPDRRVSPVGGNPVAELFADCARVLGNKRTALYMKDEPAMIRPLVMVRPPTAVVISPAIEGLPTAELRFHLGRALWLTRPEHALAVGLPKEALNGLFMSAVRAFHPRHAASRTAASGSDGDAQKLRRDLPYKVVKRLGELFQREAETTFSSAKWRRGVEHSSHRAGLMVCGDFRAAARVLRDEGDEDALRELARFMLSSAYLDLRSRG